MRVALIQMLVGMDKAANLSKAVELVAKAAKEKAKLVILPECFNSPYGNQYFPDYAETIPGETTAQLQEAARKNEVVLIGGSIPERDGANLYNTMTCYNSKGDFLGKYRKLHLFDIDVPGKFKFMESETLTGGTTPVALDTGSLRVGLGICYDMRFLELGSLYANAGCDLLIFPGAFNMTTGPVHWELTAKAQAIANQVFVAACAPARDSSASYVAWSHSMLVDPWGEVLTQAEEMETILYADVDVDYARQVRDMIPIRRQRRVDVYDSKLLTPPLILNGS